MTKIQIYDTTLRDGAQGEGVNFSLQDKLLIARRLDEFGFDFIEGGYPLSNPKDAEFFQRMAAEPLKQQPAVRVRHDAPPRREGGRRPGHEGAARFAGAGGHDRRQDARFSRDRRAARDAGRKPGR